MQRLRYAALMLLVALGLFPTVVSGASTGPHKKSADIIKSSVQLFALKCPQEIPNGDCQILWTGSGSIVSADGLVLTASHVALDDFTKPGAKPIWQAVFLTEDAKQLPKFAFFAKAVVYDAKIDLAILAPMYDINGQQIDPKSLSLTPISYPKKNTVELDDELRLIGYPGVGGDTVTVGTVKVSGFDPDKDNPEMGGAAFIKTDPGAPPGLSGGTAVDDAGQLVGVPTDGSLSEIRCQDVNHDGKIDPTTECAAMGGEAGFVRPIPESLAILEKRAQAAGQLQPDNGGDTTPVPQTPEAQPTPGTDETPSTLPSPSPRPSQRPKPTPKVPDPTGKTANVTGTLVSADTGDPIAGGYFVVLKPGISVKDFDTNNPDQIFTIGKSNASGRFQLQSPVRRDQQYSIIVVADGYAALAGDAIVLAKADDPSTVDLGEIKMQTQQ